MTIEIATGADIESILMLQKTAYQSEAALCNDYTIPPLTDTLEEIRAEFQKQLFLKAIEDGIITGSVRAFARGATCYIGRLMVDPNHQGKGIGTLLMHAIEEQFPQVKRFELFTGEKSERNLYLYNKLGYRRMRTERVNDNLTLIYLEKLQCTKWQQQPRVESQESTSRDFA